MSNDQKATFWQEAIEKQERSGLRVSEYCEREGHKKRCFYYWRRKLRSVPGPGFNSGYQVSPQGSGFIEISSTENSSGVRVVIGEKLILEIDRGFDPSTLTSAVYCLLRESRCLR
jgi:hypothetical protein